MLCSVQSGKGHGEVDGGSNWVDRRKGFPITDNVVDVDQSHSASPSLNPNSSFPAITNILSDLFCISPPSSSAKKYPRKQPSPKIFSLLISSNDDQDKHLLPGFSKTELTVIDTSSDLWKSDKLIFRRNHVWKITDKNHHSRYTTNARNTTALLSSQTSPTINKKKKKKNAAHTLIPRNQSLHPFNQEDNAEHCSGPEVSANAPNSSNEKNAYSLLQENGSYDPENGDQPRP